jgi:hypothetical protein
MPKSAAFEDVLSNKEFVMQIKWVVDADILIQEGIVNDLDNLREIGSVELTSIELKDKEC